MDIDNKDFTQTMTAWWQYNQDLYSIFSANLFKNSPVQKALNEQSAEDFGQWAQEITKQPELFAKQQLNWWQEQLKIVQQTWEQSVNASSEEVISTERGDKRFLASEWQDNPWFSYIKQSYLLFGQSLLDSIRQTPGLDEKLKERLEFFARQVINSISPSNFITTNPELLKLTIESEGQNLINGLELFKKDMAKSGDMLRISMTNENAYELGKDLATTPGRVVFQNHLFELIQYKATTKDVYKTPLLFVPPYVNKFYILDLKEENSYVKWAVDNGHTVFMISWKNPDPSMSEIGFDDYVVDGVIAALDEIEKLTGEAYVNAIGYCIAGTLVATAMAYFTSKRMKQKIKSATLLTTLLDFSQPGELGVFVNEGTVSALEAYNRQNGVMHGHLLGVSFSMLRENSLYWNYYVNNYLKGQPPMDLDLLYWNGDSTNLTAKCHNFMLRDLYLENRLIETKEVDIRGTKIDLAKVKQPIYALSTRDDHIALWQATFKGFQFTSSKTTFVLGESGHIAGVINPPKADKYGFWSGPTPEGDANAWLEKAEHSKGSWWPHWGKWITQFTEEKVPARAIKTKANPGIYDAPGEYVKARL
ncbi:class I poly(R)-hydroxyalkanoic acid synthase [Pseudoalteromonas luteoviolacea]|uniref:Poly(3-hydroxyalkanoate) synthetase n=1 Tax=Pseudoalteromonas luteoviolacea DSM 6061 TaxID=1365250 RepID=A0A166YIL6_9GAMM|nr:class I poly(R)-hydroxyalkanoic acid synthase [Pseudoalteromonas luteoviolacea]KZN42668.1 poly(3-hydroxyalkanoate) synthetase [Pseudoalteromonas luteoviolacea DSM 6061]KZN59934.1 poly(3-hydroxyalkanoate) synthetase [Pseudoalteromonas luteoviolacea CPMOR-2]MBE0385138.1 polyhydroxyalkanoate synthase [Pseudoalteromonas luteoviolacea DSM 6061]TQF69795.1 class I poly(R)-hydroxyalkanoic acid synthase [Pseudoalteromonas luteoviolacea]